jgi:hypothetical protein
MAKKPPAPSLEGVLDALNQENRRARSILPRLPTVIGEAAGVKPPLRRCTITVEDKQGDEETYQAWLTPGQWNYVKEAGQDKDQVAWRLLDLLSGIDRAIGDAILGLLAAFRVYKKAGGQRKGTWQAGQCWFGTTCRCLTQPNCGAAGGTGWKNSPCPQWRPPT